jgi:hypothetical protein
MNDSSRLKAPKLNCAQHVTKSPIVHKSASLTLRLRPHFQLQHLLSLGCTFDLYYAEMHTISGDLGAFELLPENSQRETPQGYIGAPPPPEEPNNLTRVRSILRIPLRRFIVFDRSP